MKSFFSLLLQAVFLLAIGASTDTVASEEDRAEDFKFAYLAVAGPGNGPGAAGHSFIVFSQRESVYGNAVAFQYALDFDQLNIESSVDEESPWLGQQIQMAGDRVEQMQIMRNAPIHFSVVKASYLLSKYSSEQRQVWFYPLEISEEVVQEAYAEFIADKDQVVLTPEGKQVKYDIIKGNCASFLLNKLNTVLSRYGLEEFPLLWDEELELKVSALGSLDNLSSFVPFLWVEVIAEHELVGEAFVEDSAFVKNKRLLATWMVKYRTLMETCGKSEEEIQIFSSSMASQKIREKQGFRELLLGQIEACSESAESSKDLRVLVALSRILTPKVYLFEGSNTVF